MTVEKVWTITQLQTYPQSEGEADVVCAAAWNVSGTDGTYTGSLNGSTAFKLDPTAPYIPFDQLTEPQVEGWTKDALGAETVDAMYTNIAGQIENQINPKTISLPPPWQTAA